MATCRECERKHAREWKAANKEHALQYTRDWKAKNKEHVSEYNSSYSIENRDVIQKRSTAYHVMRYQTDPNFRLARQIRSKCKVAIKNANPPQSALENLGCTQRFFKAWLQYNFTSNMSFENHGNVWHIDHAIPISKFDLNDENERLKCCHWTNCQPMLARANQSKNNRITKDIIDVHESLIEKFINALSNDMKNECTIINVNRLAYIK
jgi:hypothetical protein